MTDLLSPQQLVELIKLELKVSVTDRQVRNWCAAGMDGAQLCGKRWRISPEPAKARRLIRRAGDRELEEFMRRKADHLKQARKGQTAD